MVLLNMIWKTNFSSTKIDFLKTGFASRLVLWASRIAPESLPYTPCYLVRWKSKKETGSHGFFFLIFSYSVVCFCPLFSSTWNRDITCHMTNWDSLRNTDQIYQIKLVQWNCQLLTFLICKEICKFHYGLYFSWQKPPGYSEKN